MLLLKTLYISTAETYPCTTRCGTSGIPHTTVKLFEGKNWIKSLTVKNASYN